ncbi:hypothetical protein P7K49_004952, partial [Saguinus oedipus]
YSGCPASCSACKPWPALRQVPGKQKLSSWAQLMAGFAAEGSPPYWEMDKNGTPWGQ